MGWFRWMALFVILVMLVLAANILLHDGMDHGVGLDQFLAGTSSPWQLFINQDLVSGLLLAVTWIIWREQGDRPLGTLAWVWLIMWWGNLVVAAYVLVALREAGGDPARLFLGRRAGAAAWGWRPALPVRVGLLALAAATGTYLVLALAGAQSPVAAAGTFLGFAPILLASLLLARPAAKVA